MSQKLLKVCVAALTAVAFFSFGLLAFHEKQDVLNFQPEPSSTSASKPNPFRRPPGRPVQNDRSFPSVTVTSIGENELPSVIAHDEINPVDTSVPSLPTSHAPELLEPGQDGPSFDVPSLNIPSLEDDKPMAEPEHTDNNFAESVTPATPHSENPGAEEALSQNQPASEQAISNSIEENTPESKPEQGVGIGANPVEIEPPSLKNYLQAYTMPGSERFSDAYSLFVDAWSTVVAKNLHEIYLAHKFISLPDSCAKAWDTLIEGQSAVADLITAKFASLGTEFLEKLDALIKERSQKAIEEHDQKVEEEKNREEREFWNRHWGDEVRIREETERKLILANKRIRADHFEIAEDRKHLSPKPEEILILSGHNFNDRNDYHWRINEDAIENRNEYAAYHGYRHVFLNFSKYDAAKSSVSHPCWLKLPAIQEVLHKHPETKWLWWLDMDAIIWNATIKLEDHLLHPDALARRIVPDLAVAGVAQSHFRGGQTPPEGEFNTEEALFIYAPDSAGFNAGSFFIKNTQKSRDMLDFWGNPEFNYNDAHHEKFDLREQEGFVYLYTLHRMFRDTTAVVPQAVLNSYGPNDDHIVRQGHEGDFVIHFPSKSNDGDYEEVWDTVMRARILPDGSRFDPEFKYPEKWAPLDENYV